MPRILIVGAGISGLAVAHFLEALLPAAEVVVVESAPRVGGKILTLARDGWTVEAGPNGFLDNSPATLGLARAAGLEPLMEPASEASGKNRFLLLDGKLRKLPLSLLSFLASDLLSPMGKLDLLMERFRPRRRSLREESIDAFARRRAGREVASTLADAFVTGILAGDPKLLSVQASFPRLAAHERDHGSVMAGFARARQGRPAGARQRMWSFAGGMGTLVAAVAGGLRTPPLLDHPVRRLARQERGWRVEAGNASWQADAVVLACPPSAQAGMLRGLDAGLAEGIAGIPMNRIACVALGYRREEVPHPLDGFGYLSPQRTRRDVLGAQWCSSIFADRAPAGRVLLRALCGGWHRGDVLEWDDERLVAAVRAEFAQALGMRAAPVFREVVRWPEGIPQYIGGSSGARRPDRRAGRHASWAVPGRQRLSGGVAQRLRAGRRAPRRPRLGIPCRPLAASPAGVITSTLTPPETPPMNSSWLRCILALLLAVLVGALVLARPDGKKPRKEEEDDPPAKKKEVEETPPRPGKSRVLDIDDEPKEKASKPAGDLAGLARSESDPETRALYERPGRPRRRAGGEAGL